jgi:hypothetical protein
VRNALTPLCLVAVALLAAPAQGASLCVGTPGCFQTIQAALVAAEDGDVIRVGPGTFAGGITIDRSVRLIGAGARATTIEGGGPVITIGELWATSQPTVSIRAVTITGGSTTVKPFDYWATAGGGVWIPPAAGFAPAAVVDIRDSVITRNVVAPAGADPPEPFCGPVGCSFANGGGIANSGTLTLTDTWVSENSVGPSAAHEAVAGGIRNQPMATLTLRRSFVVGNTVSATAPNGILAVAGGISDHGVLRIADSVISENSVDVAASSPEEVAAFTGGIELSGGATASIKRTIVHGNSVRVTNTGGDVFAGVGGISTDESITLDLRDSTIDRNTVTAITTAGEANAIAYAGGIELEGTVEMSKTRVIANVVRATTVGGAALMGGGGISAATHQPTTVSDVVVARNRLEARSTSGYVLARGAGVNNAGTLTLRRVSLIGNSASATGPFGDVQGGGLWNGLIAFPDFPEVVRLTLVDSRIVGNTANGSDGVLPLGGGLYTDFPVTLKRTVIARNRPDGCFGC